MNQYRINDWFEAVKQGNKEKVKWLLEYNESLGLDVNIQNKNGWTALMCASLYGYTGIAKLFLEAGADVNMKNNKGDTALIWASFYSYTEIVKLLLEAGADVNIQNNNGHTALMWASNEENIEIIELLENYNSNKKTNSKINLKLLSVDFEEKTITLELPDNIIENNGFVSGEVNVDLSNVLRNIKQEYNASKQSKP